MSARRNLAVWLSGALLSGGVALAADDAMPEVAFLEYLGMWEQSDDEWLALEDDDSVQAAEPDERLDPAPRGEESTEKVR